MRPSFWLDQLEPLPLRPSLPGDRCADVCIVGGGFTGLWTALELRRADPGRRQWRGPDDTLLLDAGALQERIAIANGIGALYTPWCARVQPARLATGVAGAAEAAGARIFERSRVLGVEARSTDHPP